MSSLRFLKYAIVSIFLIGHSTVIAQKPLVDQNVTLLEVIELVESNTNYRVYTIGDNLLTKEFALSSSVKLDETVFDHLKLDYQIFGDELFIIVGSYMSFSLPKGFLDPGKDSENVVLVDISNNGAGNDENGMVEIGNKTNILVDRSAVISGRVINRDSEEGILGASVFVKDPLIGVVTGVDGSYSLRIPTGRHEVFVSSLGMVNTSESILLYSSGNLDFAMNTDRTALDEVVVEAGRTVSLLQPQVGLERIDLENIKSVPTGLGEADIIQTMLNLPGVKSTGEVSTGFNVRGGASDQNLILFDKITIYNSSHLFGFFSAFNSDVLGKVELYKGGIPSRFGGRLSSVLEIETKNADTASYNLSGGIGLISTRLAFDGPFNRGRTRVVGSARANYSNWLLNTVDNSDFANSEGFFYDYNLKVVHDFGKRNSVQFSTYRSFDEFKLRQDTVYSYRNEGYSLFWNKEFTNLTFLEAGASYSKYSFDVSSRSNPINSFLLDYSIEQYDFRADLSRTFGNRHSVNLGVDSKFYVLKPGSIVPNSQESIVVSDNLEEERANEMSIFFSDNFDISRKLNIEAGIRLTNFQALGEREVFVYQPDIPKSINSIIDTITFGSGERIVAYNRLNYRVAARFQLSDNSAFKLAYNTLNQFVHRISNTQAVSPTDIWKLSDRNIRPQGGVQYAIGYFHNSENRVYDFSVESYLKQFSNIIDYKSGATLILNRNLEADLINTKGRSYGIEIQLEKVRGVFTGSFAYSYSRSFQQQDDNLAGELVNRGEWYPAIQDRPHALNLQTNYDFSRRYRFSCNATYISGVPLTIPLESFSYSGLDRFVYSDRNVFRVPNYFRIDIALNVEGSHRLKKLAHGSWTFGIYNLTGRNNANSVYFRSEDSGVQGYQLSIFARAIPSITYNFRL